MILYHYTTAPGLEGIIRTKSIWASDYRFLNDATEFNYGLSIFEKTFDSRIFNSIHPDLDEIIGNFRKANSEFSILIASFCKDSDLLSQWRGYNGAVGYSVGIHADWLSQNADAQGFRLVPVCYDIGTQQRVFHDEIELLRALVKEMPESRNIWEIARDWWAHMLLVLASLKNEHFKEENEYRLVKATNGWPMGISTRPAPQGLIPYQAVKLDAKIIDNPLFHRNNVGIERIVVGPALRDQQRVAVDALLAPQHMRVEIVKSGIPFLPT